MNVLLAADAIPNPNIQLDDQVTIQLDSAPNFDTGTDMTKPETTKPERVSTTPSASSDRPLLCKDILSRDQHWSSPNSVTTEWACTSDSESSLSSDSELWSDDEADDSDEFVLCLTSKGARPILSTNSLCPALPRRLSFKPLEAAHQGVDEPHQNETDNYQVTRGEPELQSSQPVLFKNDSVTVSKSTIAGWGAFAAKDLKYGDTILLEKPLFKADSSSLFKEFSKLSPEMQEVALGLHANEMCKPGTPKLHAIWMANCFSTGVGDMAGLFPTASRFNHACNPKDNVEYTFDNAHDALEMVVKADTIPAGQELTISYGTKRRPLDLFLRYGFRCRCGACPGLVENDPSEIW